MENNNKNNSLLINICIIEDYHAIDEDVFTIQTEHLQKKKTLFHGLPTSMEMFKWHMQVYSCNMRFVSLCLVSAAQNEYVRDTVAEHSGYMDAKMRKEEAKKCISGAFGTKRQPEIYYEQLIQSRTEPLPQCPGRRSPPQWWAGRLSARWPPRTAPHRQTPAAGPTWGTASRSGSANVRLGWVNRLTDASEREVRQVNRTPTSVTWLCEEKKTRAKGSERPLLSAANRLRAWYMCALSWNTCFTAGHTRLKWQKLYSLCKALVYFI